MANFKPFGSGAFGEDTHVPFYAGTTLDDLKAVGGLTFYKDYSEETLDATYSVGSGTATFTSARDATHPATYIDSAGLIQTTTTADVGRWDYGYYDATGYHAFDNPMLHIEGAATNLITKSNNVEDAIWTKTNVTADNDDAGSASPDGTATAPSLTASDANGTFILATGVTAETYSVWIKRKTGTGVISINSDGSTYAEVAVTTAWRRFQVSAASAEQTCGIKIATDTDAIYIWGNQFEASPYATSFIPTTAAALSRTAEVLTYAMTGNRTVATETIIVNFAPDSDFANDGIDRTLNYTDTKDRRLYKTGLSDRLRLDPNPVDSGTSNATSTTVPLANVDYLISAAMQNDAASPYLTLYENGVEGPTGTTNFTSIAIGTNFAIGARPSGAFPLNGHITSTTFYSKALSGAEQATIAGIL